MISRLTDRFSCVLSCVSVKLNPTAAAPELLNFVVRPVLSHSGGSSGYSSLTFILPVI
ncbi:MAG: hypothetical protein J07HR59_00600 [Halorubrum sp. J07HR59]|nr:MAG: hypothetical protein J07HR59_00600 [Halorubrum sp. J07HR59]